MRPVSLLPLLAGLALACAPADTELTSEALRAGIGPAAEGLALSTKPMATGRVAPYAGANFDLRIELGSINPNAPKLGVFPERVLMEINDDWAALQPQDWDEVREIRYTQSQRWAGIWQGIPYEGDLTKLSIMLAEDAHLTMDDVSYDLAIPADQRELDVFVTLDTVHPRPLVVTVMVDVQMPEGQLTLFPEKVLIREIDHAGWPRDYVPPVD